jgi:hypothetical protein
MMRTPSQGCRFAATPLLTRPAMASSIRYPFIESVRLADPFPYFLMTLPGTRSETF